MLRNDVEGIAAVNRLIDHGVEVLRGPSGAFAVLEGPRAELEALAASASCADTLTSAPEFQRRVRRPRIAVYGGQGVDQRHHVLEGSVRYALDRMGFPYISIAAGDVRDGILNGVQLLIVPGGWAREIVDGWEDPPLPWQPPGPRDGLGPGGVSEIRKFVDGGGRYLGIGSGGGLLASHAYAGLVDADVVDELLGEARTMIQTVGSHPLVDGLPPYVDEAGRSVPGWLAVPYFSEVFSAVHGGPIFKAGPAARVLAEYVGVDDPAAVRDPERFEAAAHTPAILYQPVGRGWAAIIAFEPGLRGVGAAHAAACERRVPGWQPSIQRRGAPLTREGRVGLGALCAYPTVGALTERFGSRAVSATGASVALLGTLPFALFGAHGLSIAMVCVFLFVRGVGMSSIGIPSVTAAYSGLPNQRSPSPRRPSTSRSASVGPSSRCCWRSSPVPHEGSCGRHTAGVRCHILGAVCGSHRRDRRGTPAARTTSGP